MKSTTNSGTIKMSFNTKQIEITDDTNDTKKMNFDLSSIAPSTTVSLIAPTQNGTILTTSSSVVASKLKTATTEVDISGATAPSTGQILTAVNGVSASWQTPSSGGGNPFADNQSLIKNNTDNTKQLRITVANVPTGNTYQVAYPSTNNSDTLVTVNATQSISSKTLLNSTANNETNNIVANGLKQQTGLPGTAVAITNSPVDGQVLTTSSSTSAFWKTPQDLSILESAAISLPITVSTAYNGDLGNLFTNVVYNNGTLYNTTTKYFSFTNTGLYLITFKAIITAASNIATFRVEDAFGNDSMGTLIDRYVTASQKNTICASGVYLYPSGSQLNTQLYTSGSVTFEKQGGQNCIFSVVRLG